MPFLPLALLAALSWAQDAPLERGLPAIAISGVDKAGIVHWAKLQPPTPGESAVVALLKAGRYKEAETQAKALASGRPDRFEGHSLLIQAAVGQKSLPVLRSLLGWYAARKAGGGASDALGYALVLEKVTANQGQSTDDDLKKVKVALSDAQRKLDFSKVGDAIALADAWSSDYVGEHAKARELGRQTVRANEKDVQARFFLTHLYSIGILASNAPFPADAKPQPRMALKEAEAIIKLNPKFHPAYYLGGLARLELGDRQGSRDWLRKYMALTTLKSGPAYEAAKRLVGQLGG